MPFGREISEQNGPKGPVPSIPKAFTRANGDAQTSTMHVDGYCNLIWRLVPECGGFG